MEDERPVRRNALRRSVSTIGFISQYENLAVREARSFTGALEELRGQNIKLTKAYQRFKDEGSQMIDHGCITKEVNSNQVFIVTEDMLIHRGKNYTMNDIAIRWKKDCRMWLWKSKHLKKRNKSIAELREQLQSIKILK